MGNSIEIRRFRCVPALLALLEDRVVYQPSAEEFAEALAILVECGAVREVGR